MSSNATLTPRSMFTSLEHSQLERLVTALIVVWAPREPARLGEVMLLPPHPDHAGWLLGRGDPENDGPWRRLQLVRQRPGDTRNSGYPHTHTLSRRQLEIQVLNDSDLTVRNVGRCPMVLNGLEVTEARIRPGDLLEMRNQLMFLCARRAIQLKLPFNNIPLELPDFGQPDRHGMVGESPAMWEVRQQIALLALHEEHVLILGASGTGKELAAQAIHARSPRGNRPLVSRNAATFPETLIDVELFGNVKNFPNPGMSERPGLIGEARGSTLFLDEIGELPLELQPRLLRVLDRGEYQRLGDATVRRSDFRLIAATNRPPADLKHDLRARLLLSLELPGLEARREDIPLLVRSLLRRMAERNPYIAQRYFEQGDPRLEARISPAFLRFLLQRTYATQVRELERLLFLSIAKGEAPDYLDIPPYVTEADGPEMASDPKVRTDTARRAPGTRNLEAAQNPENARFTAGNAAQNPENARFTAGNAAQPPENATFTAGNAAQNPENATFTDEDRRRLRLFREVDFRVESYANHPAIQRNRSTANLHLLVLLFKALCASQFQLEAAAALLAGPSVHQRALHRRIEQHLEELAEQLSTEGAVSLKTRLRSRYRSDFPWAAQVVDALQDRRICLEDP